MVGLGVAAELVPLLEIGVVAVQSQEGQVGRVRGKKFLLAENYGDSAGVSCITTDLFVTTVVPIILSCIVCFPAPRKAQQLSTTRAISISG